MTKYKPGLVTTEFVAMFVSWIVGIGVMKGIISPDDADSLVKAVSEIVGAVIIIWTSVAYIWSRTHIKKEQIRATQAIEEKKIEELGGRG